MQVWIPMENNPNSTASQDSSSGAAEGQQLLHADLGEAPEGHFACALPGDEEDSHSEHSDSWEVISRGAHADSSSPRSHASSTDHHAGTSHPAQSEAGSEGHLSPDAYIFSLTAEDIQSDAETHRTDDLLRRGEPDFGTVSPAVTPPESLSPTDDEDQLKQASTPEIEESSHATYHAEGRCNERKFFACPAAIASAACGQVAAGACSVGRGIEKVLRFLANPDFHALTVQFRAFVAKHQPEAQRLVSLMTSTVRDLARSLQSFAASGVKTLALCCPMSGARVAANDVAGTVCQAARKMTLRARKGVDEFSFRSIDWVKVGLMIGSAAMLGMLWRVNAANSVLKARLMQREGELAELIARIIALQRNITSQRVPIIRHTSTATAMVGSWPAVVQAI